MVKDIREMTLGEVEDLLLKQYFKVEKSDYWLFDKKNYVMDMLLNLNKCVINLRKNQKFILFLSRKLHPSGWRGIESDLLLLN